MYICVHAHKCIRTYPFHYPLLVPPSPLNTMAFSTGPHSTFMTSYVCLFTSTKFRVVFLSTGGAWVTHQ